MKKNVSIRMFCMLLAVLLLFSILPLTVVAVDDVALPEVTLPTEENVILPSDPAIAEEVTQEYLPYVLGPGELTAAQLQTATLAAKDIPEVIPLGKVEAKQHVNRLYAQETDLYTVKFQNRDGSKTDYIFKQPVKYVAEDGTVRDISTQPVSGKYALRGKTYTYALLEHSVKQYFPAQIGNGILMEIGGRFVEMLPQTTYTPLTVKTARLQENALLYEDVFGAGIDLRYTPVAKGLKEDVVLASYTGVNSFSFLFRTNGLTVAEQEGEYYLFDENGFPCASLGKVLVYDSNMHFSRGEMTVAELVAGNTYRVTLTVDAAFLRSPDTVYPVTVDPTIIADQDYFGNALLTMIEDYGLYKDGMISYTDEMHLLGWMEDDEVIGSIGRIVYRFPFFHENGNIAWDTYQNYTSGKIGSVKLNIKGGGVDTANVKIYPLMQYWSLTQNAVENDTYWNQTLPSAHMVTGVLDAYDAYNTLDITEIFRKWADYNAGDTSKPNPANGLILVNDNEENTDNVWIIYVAEDTQNDVYVEIDYATMGGTYFVRNAETGKMMKGASSGTPQATYYNTTNSFEWRIQYVGNNKYTISNSYGKFLYVTGSNTLSVGSKPATLTNSYLWQRTGYTIKNVATNLVLYHANNATQVSLVTARSSSAADYRNTQWYLATEYTPLTDFSLPEEYHVFPYTGASASYQLSLDIVGENDPWVWEQDFYWSVSDSTFSITSTYSSSGLLTVPADGGVTNVIIRHKTTGMQKSYRVVCGELLEDVCYILENKSTGRYMDLQGPSMSNGAPVQQWDFHTGDQAQFKFTLVAANTYWIQSVYSGKYLSVPDASTVSGTVVCQNVLTDFPHNKWVITKTGSGAYRISPLHMPNYAIAVPSTADQNGTDLVQQAYTADSNYRDEWYIKPSDYFVTVNVYFDAAFFVRYGNNDIQNIIILFSNMEEIVCAMTQEQFHLTVIFSEPQLYLSVADRCKISRGVGVISSTIDQPCPDNPVLRGSATGNICDNHESGADCTERYKSFSEFYSHEEHKGTETEISALFIGNALYSDEAEGENPKLANRSYAYYPEHQIYGMCLQNIRYTSLQQYLEEGSFVVLHEIMHQFGVKDHYHEENDNGVCKNKQYGCSECGTPKRPPNCLMKTQDPNKVRESILCDSCKQEMLMHLADHH